MENEEVESSDYTNSQSKRRRVIIGPQQSSSVGKVNVDAEFLDEVVCFVKKNRQRALTASERLDILLLQAALRYEHEEKQKKVGVGRSVKAPKISNRIAKWLRRKEQLVRVALLHCKRWLQTGIQKQVSFHTVD